jgi:hypothetical protein
MIRESFVKGQSQKQLPKDTSIIIETASYHSSAEFNSQCKSGSEAQDSVQFSLMIDAASQMELTSQSYIASDASNMSVYSSESSMGSSTIMTGIGAKIAKRDFHSPGMPRKNLGGAAAIPKFKMASADTDAESTPGESELSSVSASQNLSH